MPHKEQPTYSHRQNQDATIGVYLVHDCRLLTEGLEAEVETRPEISMIGATGSRSRALQELGDSPTDVLLIDVHIGETAAIELVHEVRRAYPRLAVVPLGVSSEDRVLPFLEAGASGYLLRSASISDFFATLQAVHRGEPPCSPRIATSVCQRLAQLTAEKDRRQKLRNVNLTPRETEILNLIAEGRRNKEIASSLAISTATVKNHVHRILEKLQAPTRRQAILQAYKGGLVKSPIPKLPAVRRDEASG